MARFLDISDAKAQLPELVAAVQDGSRVVIGRSGRPVAVLVAYESTPAPRTLGGWREDEVWIADDFDEPLATLPT